MLKLLLFGEKKFLAKFLFFSKNDLPNLLSKGFCITWQSSSSSLISVFPFFSGGTLVPTSCCTVDVLWSVVVAAAVFLDSSA
jgi:hypothetical protein